MRFLVERQDYPEPCEHGNPRRCRAQGPDRSGSYWHNRRRWHVWDSERDDYAEGTGPHQFPRRRDAAEWLDARSR